MASDQPSKLQVNVRVGEDTKRLLDTLAYLLDAPRDYVVARGLCCYAILTLQHRLLSREREALLRSVLADAEKEEAPR